MSRKKADNMAGKDEGNELIDGTIAGTVITEYGPPPIGGSSSNNVTFDRDGRKIRGGTVTTAGDTRRYAEERVKIEGENMNSSNGGLAILLSFLVKEVTQGINVW